MTTTAKHTPLNWHRGEPNQTEYQDGSNWVVPIYAVNANPGDRMPAEARATDRKQARANADLIITACNAHDDLLAACNAALEERTLRDELSSIGARARSKHTQTVESIRLDETRKREILARIIEIGRITRAAIRKAGGEA